MHDIVSKSYRCTRLSRHVAGILEQAAEAAEYIPDPIPRPADEADIPRWNGAMNYISKRTGLPTPQVDTGRSAGFRGYFIVNGRIDAARLRDELDRIEAEGK